MLSIFVLLSFCMSAFKCSYVFSISACVVISFFLQVYLYFLHLCLCHSSFKCTYISLFVFMSLFILPLHSTSPSPSKPSLHLQTKCAGRLQHSALETHLKQDDGRVRAVVVAQLVMWLFMTKDVCSLRPILS